MCEAQIIFEDWGFAKLYVPCSAELDNIHELHPEVILSALIEKLKLYWKMIAREMAKSVHLRILTQDGTPFYCAHYF